MRTLRHLAPVLLGGLILAGCSGGSQTDGTAPVTPTAATDTASAAPPTTTAPPATAAPTSTPTASPTTTVSAAPDRVMPALHGRTYEEARAEFTRRGLSAARLTTAAQHKDVTLSRDHDAWYVCASSPRPGAPLSAATTVTVNLAKDFSDCTTSFHGYLHQENDPAYTPPPAGS
ncbi:PASTA domain-containing protein [Streptomyces sp. NPDC006267]|uniref:PASTA domain-containing protein n=1 Tax=Streptomyces sp. NPDC006267 TaxID=3157173 RepID=UPI0033B47B05